MPTPTAIRLPAPLAVGEFLRSFMDFELQRAFPVAAVAVAILAIVLPRGRKRLVTLPALLLVAAALPPLLTQLFPDSTHAPVEARSAAKFFLLAALLLSLLRIALVGVWERIARPVSRIVLDVVGWLLVGASLVATLYDAGIAAGDLFTGSAVVTAVLGFALRDTLGNVFAGLAIHAERPFEVGDWIQYDAVPAHVGRVVEINWRATKVLTLDDAHVTIPNGQLAQASIRNFTKPEAWSRRSLFVVTPYDVPPQRVQAIILEAVRGSFGVLDQPAPSVVTNAFTERGVEHWVRLFTTAFDQRDRVDGAARDRIWYALARNGIRIPVATHAVQLSEPPAPESPAAAVERRAGCLEGIDLLEPLNPGLVRRLAESSVDHAYAAGEQVVRQGEPGSSMFVILSGRVEVTARAAADVPVAVLAVLGPGDHFGEMSVMTGAPRTATVTTLGETRLLEIGKEGFAAILSADPGLVEALGRSLKARQAERREAIADAGRPAAEPQDLLGGIREFFGL
ncbi:MAG: cyclic nucleotide-binding domain-containing protein [Planctomycetaceae bacterium]